MHIEYRIHIHINEHIHIRIDIDTLIVALCGVEEDSNNNLEYSPLLCRAEGANIKVMSERVDHCFVGLSGSIVSTQVAGKYVACAQVRGKY